MSMNVREKVNSRLQTFSRASSVVTFLTGLLVLIGWKFDIAVLMSVLPGTVTMKAEEV